MSEQTKQEKTIIFYDTETTGLPLDFNAYFVEETEAWDTARPIQIAWKRYTLEGRLISTHCHIIKPDGFVIPVEATEKHGIEHHFAEQHGDGIRDVLKLFVSHLRTCSMLVAHNISYDFNVIGAEMVRLGMEAVDINELITTAKVCTMKSTTEFCKIPSQHRANSYKWAKLEELHEILFGQKFDGAHDALVDVDAMQRCFFELKNKHGFNWQALKDQF